MDIDADRAVPFGLLVNELATNAVKHAFPGGRGRVLLSARRIGNQIELAIADDGIGMKAKDPAKLSEQRGSNYVAIFVRQLGSTIVALESAPGKTGTVVTVRLPLVVVPSGGTERIAA